MKNINSAILIFIATTCAVLFSSCNRSIDTESVPQNNTPANTLALTIDSVNYTWKAAGTSVLHSGEVFVTVEAADTTNNGSRLGFTLINVTRPGTYGVNVYRTDGSPTASVNISSENMTNGFPTSYFSSAIPEGRFTVQSVSQDSLKATFNATLTKGSGPQSAPISITVAGSVNVALHSD